MGYDPLHAAEEEINQCHPYWMQDEKNARIIVTKRTMGVQKRRRNDHPRIMKSYQASRCQVA